MRPLGILPVQVGSRSLSRYSRPCIIRFPILLWVFLPSAYPLGFFCPLGYLRILASSATLHAMIDIAKHHRSFESPKILAKFFSTSGFRAARDALLKTGLTTPDIVKRKMPYRGQPSVALVHPLISLEYLRWVDYDKFAKWALTQTTQKTDVADNERTE